jgi:radical SAM protein with 4Fe4S-binding SPASM domain
MPHELDVMNVLAILSMLHEPPVGSATRLFRGQPVLRWTLQRLARSHQVTSTAILCWDDQAAAVEPLANEWGARAIPKGARSPIAHLNAISAAQRWTDGWRGGLLATCKFDLGFHGPWHAAVAEQANCDAVVLVDPSSGLVDPELIDALAAHGQLHHEKEFCFMQAAPGLAGVWLRPSLLKRLAAANAHAGRLLHYFDDQLGKEPVATDCCASSPTPVARSSDRFTLDSDRQVARLSCSLGSLNGQLLGSGAQEIVRRVAASAAPDVLPREIVLELNTDRSTRPIFWPGRTLSIERPNMSLSVARQLLEELASLDDTRLTLSGVGDPLLSPILFEVMEFARGAKLAIHVETDLVGIPAGMLGRLAGSGIDVLSFHLPALSAQSYEAVMGRDGYIEVLENIRQLLLARREVGSSIPILVPIFTKCQQNLAQMEAWYDQWLRAVGSAVIRGPGTCAGQIPDVAVADMSPSGRRACGRISSRVTILSDGRVVSCEEDVTALQVMGQLGRQTLAEIWQKRFEALRDDHRKGKWDRYSLCDRCKEWHRP